MLLFSVVIWSVQNTSASLCCVFRLLEKAVFRLTLNEITDALTDRKSLDGEAKRKATRSADRKVFGRAPDGN